MSRDLQFELGESLPRFTTHWIAASFGYSLMILLPHIAEWPRKLPHGAWPHWSALLIGSALTSLIAAFINANLPVTPRELIKSVALGCALNATLIALKVAWSAP